MSADMMARALEQLYKLMQGVIHKYPNAFAKMFRECSTRYQLGQRIKWVFYNSDLFGSHKQEIDLWIVKYIVQSTFELNSHFYMMCVDADLVEKLIGYIEKPGFFEVCMMAVMNVLIDDNMWINLMLKSGLMYKICQYLSKSEYPENIRALDKIDFVIKVLNKLKLPVANVPPADPGDPDAQDLLRTHTAEGRRTAFSRNNAFDGERALCE